MIMRTRKKSILRNTARAESLLNIETITDLSEMTGLIQSLIKKAR